MFPWIERKGWESDDKWKVWGGVIVLITLWGWFHRYTHMTADQVIHFKDNILFIIPQ